MRKPHALATLGYGAIGRLPLAMNPVAIVLLISATTDSYAYAGLASGSYTLASALIGPRIGRLADLHGSRKVLIPITLVHILSMCALIKFSSSSIFLILLFAASSGASLANIGSFTRTRWGRSLSDNKELNSALSIESVLDEFSFVAGPACAGLLFAKFGPKFALIAGLLFLFIGASGLSLTSNKNDFSKNPEEHKHGLLKIVLVKPLLISLVALGCIFGGNTIAVLAVAKEAGFESQGGLLMAIYSLGSLIAGTLYGLKHWKSSNSYRYALALFFMTIATFAPAIIHIYSVLPFLLMISGVAISPTLIAANALLKDIVPNERLNEAFAFLGGAISIGITLGSAISGTFVSITGAWNGFYFVSGCAVIATCVSFFGLVAQKKVLIHE